MADKDDRCTPQPMPTTDRPDRVYPMPDAPMQYRARLTPMKINPGRAPAKDRDD